MWQGPLTMKSFMPAYDLLGFDPWAGCKSLASQLFLLLEMGRSGAAASHSHIILKPL